MYGAILGDMIGAPYEFDMGNKTKDFPLFTRRSVFTDDSVMTVAVAEALMDTKGKTDDEIKAALVSSMQKWGRKYPNAGYGGRFGQWLNTKNPKPYGSFGNGSAMRVEDVIRTAVSLGGDCDTLTCIAGSIAEAFYGVTDGLKTECRRRLPGEMLEVLDRFEAKKTDAAPKDHINELDFLYQ